MLSVKQNSILVPIIMIDKIVNCREPVTTPIKTFCSDSHHSATTVMYRQSEGSIVRGFVRVRVGVGVRVKFKVGAGVELGLGLGLGLGLVLRLSLGSG